MRNSAKGVRYTTLQVAWVLLQLQPRSVNAGTDSTTILMQSHYEFCTVRIVRGCRVIDVARFFCHCTSYPIALVATVEQWWRHQGNSRLIAYWHLPNMITYQYINAGPFQGSSSSDKGSDGTSEDSLSYSSSKPVKGRHKFPDAVFPA